LIGVRTRQIRSSLRGVMEMPESQAKLYLPIDAADVYAEESACDNKDYSEEE